MLESNFSLDRGLLNLAVHTFQPSRLTVAREYRGLAKNELAKKIQKTSSAISQFELGLSKPDKETLLSICWTLGFSPNFFATKLDKPRFDLDSCHFRSLKGTSQFDRRQALANGSLLLDLIKVLEEFVDLPEVKLLPSDREITSDKDVEEIAIGLRRQWGLGNGPIPDISKLIESKGILICPLSEKFEGIDAFSSWSEERPIIFSVFHPKAASRERFNLAHELGHLVMHVDAKPGNTDNERQANRFGSAFLMPAETFREEFPRIIDWDHFIALKHRWKVSLAAILRRGLDLELISYSTYQRAFVGLSQRGWRTEEPEEFAHEHPVMLQRAYELTNQQIKKDGTDLATAANLPEDFIGSVFMKDISGYSDSRASKISLES